MAMAHDADAKDYARVYEEEQPSSPAYVEVEMPGTPPPTHMFRPDAPPLGISENTRAEMAAGAAALKALGTQSEEEQAAGRKAVASKQPHSQE